MSLKRKPDLEVPVADENDLLQITCLGAGNEVGRSSLLLQYKGKAVLELVDGIHPAYNGLASLPFFDEIDPASIDVLLVSHFHLDHAAAVPYFMEKTSFKGRVFMTHPTQAIFKWLLSDFVRVSNIGVDDQLYTEDELMRSYQRIEAVDYHQEVDVGGIKFTSYNAGHVLGAAMFLIEIAGVKVLYTGDYSREEDRHLMAAEKPEGVQIDVLITESTYGLQSQEPRLKDDVQGTGSLIHNIVSRGGRCLMPVFALGRAQELLLILDEYWEAHPELDSIPIYYASSLAKKCMAVYQTYINMMNARIRKQFAISNPFVFKHISNLKNVEQFEDSGPCVMMASPGMLQVGLGMRRGLEWKGDWWGSILLWVLDQAFLNINSGLSRELFERWAPDMRNGLVVTGYCVEGTLARHALNEPSEIPSLDGRKIPLRCSVDYISFSAHVDYTDNAAFIDEVKAPHVIYTPKNCETLKLHFRGEKMAKTIGSLAAKYPTENQPLSGILVAKDFQLNIMGPEDLNELSGGLSTTVVTQRQSVAFHAGIGLLRWHLEMMFGKVEETITGPPGAETKEGEAKEGEVKKEEKKEKEKEAAGEAIVLRVFDTVDIKQHTHKPNELLLEWVGNAMNDMIADSVLAVVMGIESSPASVRATKHAHHHHHHADGANKDDDVSMDGNGAETVADREFDDITMFLEKQFGAVKCDNVEKSVTVNIDGMKAKVDCRDFKIESDDETLRARVAGVLERVKKTIRPISETCTAVY
ncbi:hypothetical protein BC938DRAFT_479003 [Jimgerdemannia flammicorona]|uniref:Beta-lactamase-like protein n=1 Tax=Jimgerdemannia flammicorona TaxID=994334 RepID=A0A433QLW0_9FUNG|nr:hypothetical protein BC938DRAFT_479003 [Jimgerdemannia flammicorona]